MKEERRVITQGEQAVSGDPRMVVSTLLGSCVAVCLHDPVARIGGMNHILLSPAISIGSREHLVGLNAMELLINAMRKRGAMKHRMVAKVFGGAQMVDGLSEIGAANLRFASDFLTREGLPVVARSVAGNVARQLMFWPECGVARQKFIRKGPDARDAVSLSLNPRLPTGNATSGMELF